MNDSTLSVSTGDPIGLRRRQPCNEPLPATIRWTVKLPAEVQPIALLRKFPRIANSIARSWTNAPPIHGRVIRAIEIWHVVYTRTQEHVETVERTQLEAADRK